MKGCTQAIPSNPLVSIQVICRTKMCKIG